MAARFPARRRRGLFSQAEVFCVSMKASEERRECTYACEMDLLFELCIKIKKEA